jgi:hypothetical protein
MPLTFTHEEYADMQFIYRYCNGNGEATAAEHWQCFPNHRIPYQNLFCNVHRNVTVVPSHKKMQNMRSNDVTGKLMYLVLFSKPHIHTGVHRISVQTNIA